MQYTRFEFAHNCGMKSSHDHDLLKHLAAPVIGERLFDQLSDIVFFIKNDRAEYVAVNNTLVRRCGLNEKSSVIGRTSSQIYPAPMGLRFEAQDLQVLKTGRPLQAQLELHLHPNGEAGWCKTTKLPLLKPDGAIAGLVGVSQDLRFPDASRQDYLQVAAAIEYAKDNLSVPVSVQELARFAGLSRFQFDRRIQTIFGLTAGQWLLTLRINHAQRLLADTDDAIADVAIESGYADQSAFSRQFRQATGLTPREYRVAQRAILNFNERPRV